MHAPKLVKGALVGAAITASLTLAAPAAHASTQDPGKLGYLASFHSKAECEAGGKLGAKHDYWGTFRCVQKGKYWHLLIDVNQINRAKLAEAMGE